MTTPYQWLKQHPAMGTAFWQRKERAAGGGGGKEVSKPFSNLIKRKESHREKEKSDETKQKGGKES